MSHPSPNSSSANDPPGSGSCRLYAAFPTRLVHLHHACSSRQNVGSFPLGHTNRSVDPDDTHSAVLRGAATVVTHVPPPVNIASKRVWRRLLVVQPADPIATTGAESPGRSLCRLAMAIPVPQLDTSRPCPEEHSRPDLLRHLRHRIPPHRFHCSVGHSMRSCQRFFTVTDKRFCPVQGIRRLPEMITQGNEYRHHFSTFDRSSSPRDNYQTAMHHAQQHAAPLQFGGGGHRGPIPFDSIQITHIQLYVLGCHYMYERPLPRPDNISKLQRSMESVSATTMQRTPYCRPHLSVTRDGTELMSMGSSRLHPGLPRDEDDSMVSLASTWLEH